MSYDSREDTLKHIRLFQQNLAVLFHEIARRHEAHDASKLASPEKEVFDRVTPLLRDLTYGSDEYNAMLEEMKPALDHHYAHNRHHPEHFKGTKVMQEGEVVEVHGAGMQGMTLVDLIEMFCDWCAATMRHADGDIGRSIEINRERFGYGETLAHIFCNTAQEYVIGAKSHRAYVPEREDNEEVNDG